MKVKQWLGVAMTAIAATVCIVLGLISGIRLSALQQETLWLLALICGGAALYCFVVGEITRNNSQMDKLWSLLPQVYLWVVAIKGNMAPRLVMMAVIATLWGARLTMNFARKGAYSLRFWAGEQDYRWAILRRNRLLGNRFVWALFDLCFISVYQNFVVLATTLPAVAVMDSQQALGVMDLVAAVLAIGFLGLQTIADQQQWFFQQEKKRLLSAGSPLAELPFPYCRGFNTTGLWSCSRHPNYLGEQMLWICMYLFSIGGCGVFNWSIIGCMLLVLLFLGSSALGEHISASKYSEYRAYCDKVPKYIPMPWRAY